MNLDIGLPQIIVVCLIALGGGVTLARYGNPNTKNFNFYTSLVAKVILFAILIWGDFFATIGWPQLAVIALGMLDLGAALVLHGKPQGGTYGCGGWIVSTLIMVALLYFGGFFTAVG